MYYLWHWKHWKHSLFHVGYLNNNIYIYVLFVTLDTFPLLHGHVPHAMSSNTFCNFLGMTLFSRPRMLYQFLGNKAEKGPSITTEVKVTLEQMYNGDSKGCLTLCFSATCFFLGRRDQLAVSLLVVIYVIQLWVFWMCLLWLVHMQKANQHGTSYLTQLWVTGLICFFSVVASKNWSEPVDKKYLQCR